MKIFFHYKKALNNIGERLSEDHLIKFDFRVLSLLLVSFIIFTLAVTFKIHGSSIPIWNQIVPGNDINNGLLLGSPKGTRSDEWDVTTPYTLSQVKSNPQFPLHNDTLGAGSVPLLVNVPVKHFTTLFRPQHWGYFLLDAERGFSFQWNFKTLSLFLGFFFLLMILTKNSFWLSMFGSTWLIFSSFVQWWFSTGMPEMLASFSIISVALIYLLTSNKKPLIILAAALLTIFSVDFILFLYPPFQVLLVYLCLFVLIGYLIKNGSVEAIKANLNLRIFLASIASIVVLLAMYYFYHDAKGAIKLIMGTSYPGSRRSIGGGTSLVKYFSGFYNNFTGENHVPLQLRNASEASNFVLLFPVVGFVMVLNFFSRKKYDVLQILLLIYILIVSIWMLLGFPEILAKITLWNLTTPERSHIGLGIASILLCVLFLADKGIISVEKRAALYASGITFLLLIGYGLMIRSATFKFFGLRHVLFASAIITVASFLLLKKRAILFSLLILALVIESNLLVNPISYGLSPVYGKAVVRIINQESTRRPNSKWVVYGDRLTPNFFIAAGAKVINGVKYTPEFNKLKILDPKGEFKDVYNRYAHVAFMEPQDKSQDVSFSLVAADYYVVHIDPCSDKLRKIGVTNVAFSYKPRADRLHCLAPLTNGSVNNFWLYRYKY